MVAAVIHPGEIWLGRYAGYRRPVLVIQADSFNRPDSGRDRCGHHVEQLLAMNPGRSRRIVPGGCYSRRMVDIQRAVANAIEFARNALGPERTLAIRLEEIESAVVDGRHVWLITLSSARSDIGIPAELIAATRTEFHRDYKVFTVAKDTGDVLSMKIRLFAAPAA